MLMCVIQTEVGVLLCRCSVKMMCTRLTLSLTSVQSTQPHSPWLEDTLLDLCKFPFIDRDTPSSLSLAARRLSPRCVDIVRHLVEEGQTNSEDGSDDDMTHTVKKRAKCISRYINTI